MTRAYLKYLTALLLFGSNGIVAARIALTSYEIVFTRTLIGSLLLGLLFAGLRQPVQLGRHRAHTAFLVGSGVAMGASWMFLYEAYQQIGVSVATLAYYCGPVLVMALSPWLFGEKATRGRVLGFLAVLVGMVLVNAPALAAGAAAWGLFCGVMAAVMYAFMVICNKKAAGITGLENALWQLSASFVTVAVFVAVKQGLAIHIPAGSLAPILILGLLNTGIGCYFYFSAIGHLPVQTVALTGYLEPLSALLFSAALLSERLGALQVVGAVLILGGAAVGEVWGRRLAPIRGNVA